MGAWLQAQRSCGIAHWPACRTVWRRCFVPKPPAGSSLLPLLLWIGHKLTLFSPLRCRLVLVLTEGRAGQVFMTLNGYHFVCWF